MEIKQYNIKQIINGVTYFQLSFKTTEKHYKRLLSLLYFPKKNEIIGKKNDLFYYRGYLKVKVINKNHKWYNDYCEFSTFLKFISHLQLEKFMSILKGICFDDFVVTGMKGTFGSFYNPPNIIKQGREFEEYVSKHYQKQNYEVIKNYLKEKKDNGIDIIAKKNDELLLIQCKNWEKEIISHKEIKEFLGNCYLFLYKNLEYRKYKKVRRIYVISQSRLDKSAQYLFKEYYPFVEYKKMEFDKNE